MSHTPIHRPARARQVLVPIVTAAVAALGVGTTGCDLRLDGSNSGAVPEQGQAPDNDAIAKQIDVRGTNRIPGELINAMRGDASSFDPGFDLTRVDWLVESPAGASAEASMMAAFYLPLVNDPKIVEPDLAGWYNSAIKSGTISPADLENFRTLLAEAWAAAPAIAGITPATIQFLKPADAAALAKRGAAIALAFQIATAKPTFPEAMQAIADRGGDAFTDRELGNAAFEAQRKLVEDVNAALATRDRQIGVLQQRASRNGQPPLSADPAPALSLQDFAKQAVAVAAFCAAANARAAVIPQAAGR